LAVLVFELKGFTLARQALYHLSHSSSPIQSKFKRIQVKQSMFFDHNGMKLETNNKHL
jgi:hypothetical protein